MRPKLPTAASLAAAAAAAEEVKQTLQKVLPKLPSSASLAASAKSANLGDETQTSADVPVLTSTETPSQAVLASSAGAIAGPAESAVVKPDAGNDVQPMDLDSAQVAQDAQTQPHLSSNMQTEPVKAEEEAARVEADKPSTLQQPVSDFDRSAQNCTGASSGLSD